MRALDTARKIAHQLADREGQVYVIWMVGWRTLVQPEGIEVQGGIVVEYINPRQEIPA